MTYPRWMWDAKQMDSWLGWRSVEFMPPSGQRPIVSGYLVELCDVDATISIDGQFYTGPCIRYYAPDGVRGELWADVEA